MKNQRIKDYWKTQVDRLNAIYSGEKPRFARWLDHVFRKDMFQRFDYVMENAAPFEGMVFFDLGCGTGEYVLELARRKCRLAVGVDIADRMIDICRKRAKEEKFEDRIELCVSDIMDFNPPQPADVVLAVGVFDYTKEPEVILARMKELCLNRAIMSFPRFWTWRALLRKVRLSLRGCSVYFYTRRKVERLLKEAGFKEFKIDKIGKLFCLTAWK